MTTAAAHPADVEPTLRHVVVVGGTVGQWTAASVEWWDQRIVELGKAADHAGASWLTLHPYDEGADQLLQPTGAATIVAIGGCTVATSPGADGRRRLIAAIELLRTTGKVITEATIAAAINAPAEVDPDLVVVLGPADRMPPSLAWELAYSELVFLDVEWRDLQPTHLELSFEQYASRHRRFGGLD
ncbi:MAG: undecaprenyl diphosphate synthase family protein [Ilumatobacteraceae bacterium]